MIPRSHFFAREGRAIQLALIGTTVLFILIMIVTWVASERANPVMLDLETGKPAAKRPAL